MENAMRRREFIALLGCGSLVPSLALAQQAMTVIGFLNSRSPREAAPSVAEFRKGLAKTGYAEGQNTIIEYRWAEGRYDQLPALAADLVQHRVAVIVAAGGLPSALAAKGATATIPIVFTSGGDPIAAGLVASLGRPGGNATGVSLQLAEAGAKRLEPLQELLPKVAEIAFLANPGYVAAEQEKERVLAEARSLANRIDVVTAGNVSDIDAAFETIAARHVDALMVSDDPFLISRRSQLILLAAHYALPTIYFTRDFVADGGLISYGASLADAYRQAGVYTGRILNGANPADLPVLEPTKFELVINLETAKALGLTVPAALLARADELIE
jgi:putative ABC transport system substrate-binding protein